MEIILLYETQWAKKNLTLPSWKRSMASGRVNKKKTQNHYLDEMFQWIP